MRSFGSDNNSGIHPLIMKALIEANHNHALSYGDDLWTAQAVEKIKDTFAPDCEALLVFNGTGSNVIGLQLITRPYQTIYCTNHAHILLDECGAPARETGCAIKAIIADDGKLTPELLASAIGGVGNQHENQPGAVYISQATELGTIYTPDEIRRITSFAHQHGMYVHMDGARIANAAVALGVSLRELTVDCGVDVVALGGTKNGLMLGECVIVLNPLFKEAAKYVRKQSAQLASKMRFLSCQFTAMLTDNLWKQCAWQANEKALRLHDELVKFPQVRFTQKVESNQLFLILPREVTDKLLETFCFHVWNEAVGEIRLVTSFDTTDEDIDDFINVLKGLL